MKNSEKTGDLQKKKKRSSVGWLRVLRHFQANNWTNSAAKQVMTFFFGDQPFFSLFFNNCALTNKSRPASQRPAFVQKEIEMAINLKSSDQPCCSEASRFFIAKIW